MKFRFTGSSLFAVTLLLSVGFLGNYPMLLFPVAAFCVLGLFLLDPSRSNAIVFVIVGIAGPLSEVIAIHFGSWAYAHPDFLGIPAWLPLVWGGAGLYIARLKIRLG